VIRDFNSRGSFFAATL